jgi:O-antigen/teichoic acid export membrane protein
MVYSHDELVNVASEAARGALFLFSGGTIANMVSIICSIIIARLLGPELYGVYSLSLVVPVFLLMFTDFGINPALIRFSAKLKAEKKTGQLASLIRVGFLFKLIISFTILFLGLIFSDTLAMFIINRPQLAFLVRIAVFLIFFNGILSTVNSTLIGFDDMRRSAFLSIILQVTRVILCTLLVVAGFGVFGAVLGYVLSYMLAAILGTLIVYINHYRRLSSKIEGNGFEEDLKTMVKYGSPLYFSLTLRNALGIYQRILLAWFATNAVIGNFSIALNFATLILLLTNPIATALFPAFSKLNPTGEEIKKMTKYAVKYTTILVVPASIFLAIMAKDIVYLIYGSSYNLAPEFLAFYCIIFLYAGFGSEVWKSFFNGIGETKTNLKATILYAICLFPLALLLTSSYAALGLILATLISTLVSLIYSFWVSKRKFKVVIDFRGSLNIYLASAFSASPLLILDIYSPFSGLINLIIGTISFIPLYLTITPLIGGFNQIDIENLKIIVDRTRPLKPFITLILNYEAKLIRG